MPYIKRAVLISSALAILISVGIKIKEVEETRHTTVFITSTAVSEFQPVIPFSGRINAVDRHPTNPDIVIVSTPTGGLFRSADGGTNWKPVPILASSESTRIPTIYGQDVVIHPDDPNLVIATAARDLTIYKVPPASLAKTDTNNSTEALPSSIEGRNREMPSRLNSGVLTVKDKIRTDISSGVSIILGQETEASNGGIWISNDGGRNWRRPPTVIPRATRFFTPNSICPPRAGAYDISVEPGSGYIFVGTDCGVAISKDRGESWAHKTLPNLNNGIPVISIAPLGDGIVLAGTAKKGVFISIDRGESWEKLYTTPKIDGVGGMHALSATPDHDRGLIVTNDGKLFEIDASSSIPSVTQITSAPAFGSKCGGIAYVRQFAAVDAAGQEENAYYTLYGNRCHSFVGKTILSLHGPIYPFTESGWEQLNEKHADHRYLLPRLKYDVHSASGSSSSETISGAELPVIHDGGAINGDSWKTEQWRFAAFAANDGGLDIFSQQSLTTVGSGPDKINALQVYDVASQRVRNPGIYNFYFGTQDNNIWASNDGGQSWPSHTCCEGGGFDLKPEVAQQSDAEVTFMACGNCFTKAADSQLNTREWIDPFKDRKLDTGYPFRLIDDVQRISFGADDKGTDAAHDDTYHLYRTGNDGTSWDKISNSFTLQVRDSAHLITLSGTRQDFVFGRETGKFLLPFYNGSQQVKGNRPSFIEDVGTGDGKVLNDFANLGAPVAGAANQFAMTGRMPFQFMWKATFGVNPTNPSEYIAPDLLQEMVMRTTDAGMNWQPVPSLTDAMAQNGKYYFADQHHERGHHYPNLITIEYNPKSPYMVLAGARQGGLYLSTDQGVTWKPVPGSRDITNITSIKWVNNNLALIGSYGRGLWKVSLSHHIVSKPVKRTLDINKIAWHHTIDRFVEKLLCIERQPCLFVDAASGETLPWHEIIAAPGILNGDLIMAFGGEIKGVHFENGKTVVLLSSGASIASLQLNGKTMELPSVEIQSRFANVGYRESLPQPLIDREARKTYSSILSKLPGRAKTEGSIQLVGVIVRQNEITGGIYAQQTVEWPEATIPDVEQIQENLNIAKELAARQMVKDTSPLLVARLLDKKNGSEAQEKTKAFTVEVIGKQLPKIATLRLRLEGEFDLLETDVETNGEGDMTESIELTPYFGRGYVTVELFAGKERIAKNGFVLQHGDEEEDQ